MDTSVIYPSVGFFSAEFHYPDGFTHTICEKDGHCLYKEIDYEMDLKDNLLGFFIFNEVYDSDTLVLKI